MGTISRENNTVEVKETMDVPIMELKYAIISECFDEIKKRFPKYHTNIKIVYRALNEYMPVIIFLDAEQYVFLLCLDNGNEEVKTKFKEFNEVINSINNRFNEALKIQQLEDAVLRRNLQLVRDLIENVTDNLRNLGLAQYAVTFRAIGGKLIMEVKRGKLYDAIYDINKMLARAGYEYVVRELAKKYMVLWNDVYAMTLLNPPTTGLYSIPIDFIPLMEELAKLFPGDIKVHKNPNDTDVAFAYTMRKIINSNEQFVEHLLDAYLRLNGFSLNELSEDAKRMAIDASFLMPSIIKSLKSGYDTYIIIANDAAYLIEFPRNKLKYNGNLKEAFENILGITRG